MVLILILLAATILGPVYHGYVLSKLWLWFIVPYFGLEPISIPLAIGMALILGFSTSSAHKSTGDDRGEWVIAVDAAINSFGHPTLYLLVGELVRAFV